MSNSAFTPSNNLSIPATTTQAGTVTTVAQTFAGKKTFDGGAAIKGDTTGSTIAAGYVGQRIESIGSPGINKTGTNGADVLFDSVGAPSLSLPAGVWLLYGATGLTTTNVADDILLTLYNVTGAAIVGYGTPTSSAFGLNLALPVSAMGVFAHSSGTNQVIRLFGRRNGGSTPKIGTTGASANMSCGYLLAVRIA